LSRKSRLKVEEGAEGCRLEAGKIWIAPGGFHMQVVKRKNGYELAINSDEPENSCRPAVDVLFRSVAEAFGPKVLAVVLTGMGQDGLVGAEAIRRAGGTVFVQDEASSVVWGMPGAVAKAGLADRILPLPEMPMEIQAAFYRKPPMPNPQDPSKET
jgi:two-component system, chemotaxis family, protein-glutamate methylesterase/glutaminase